jgi:undecaprenyl-phosphate galactose phosphotransferase
MVGSLQARSFVKAEQTGYEAALRLSTLFVSDGLALSLAFGGGMLMSRMMAAFGVGSTNAIDAATHAEGLVLLVGMFCYLIQCGRYTERHTFWDELRSITVASLCTALAFSCLGALSGNLSGRIEAVVALLLFPVFGTVINRYAKAFLAKLDLWDMPIIIIGNGDGAKRAEAALNSDRSFGLKVVRRVDPDLALTQPGSTTLRSLLERYQAQSFLIAIDGDAAPQKRIVHSALQERVPFAIVPEAEWLPPFSHTSKCFLGQNVMFLSRDNTLSKKIPQFLKSVLDVTVAATLIIFLLPIYLIVAALTALDGGPVIFGQTRIGAGGRKFRCLKFRTMVVDADRVLQEALAKDPARAAEWHLTRKLTNDPRITRIGRILRKTSLDELPQLFNILMLDMSLVGPRPIVETEIQYYGDNINQYYATRPGLTGLWQVSGRSDTTYAQRVQFDVWYVNNWTLWRDIVVLLKTIPAVLGAKGAR